MLMCPQNGLDLNSGLIIILVTMTHKLHCRSIINTSCNSYKGLIIKIVVKYLSDIKAVCRIGSTNCSLLVDVTQLAISASSEHSYMTLKNLMNNHYLVLSYVSSGSETQNQVKHFLGKKGTNYVSVVLSE